MNTTFMLIILAVFGGLAVAGVITTLIMKKCRAGENAVTISLLITSFMALIAAGALVFLVSVNMMKDYVNIKAYNTFTFENDAKTHKLIVREYSNDTSSGFELYFENEEKMLADVSTDMYLPFFTKEYEVEWKDDGVTLYYTYHKDDNFRSARKCTLYFDGRFDEPVATDKDLRSEEEKSAALAETSGAG